MRTRKVGSLSPKEAGVLVLPSSTTDLSAIVPTAANWVDRHESTHYAMVKAREALTSEAGVRYSAMTPAIEVITRALDEHITASLRALGETFAWSRAYSSESFSDEVVRALRETPVEEGMIHPAESIIKDAIEVDISETVGRIASVFRAASQGDAETAARLLLVISQLDFGPDRDWLLQLASDALQSEDITLRDAAVSALEEWRGKDSLDILLDHMNSEPDSWLRRRVEELMKEMSEECA